jgi:hypothetical protein
MGLPFEALLPYGIIVGVSSHMPADYLWTTAN